MHALGSQVVGIRRSQAQKPAYVERLCQMDALETLLPEMDIVAICLPGTEQTKHLFDEAKLRSMKQGALLVNVGRGNIVDTNALCRVLKAGIYLAPAWMWWSRSLCRQNIRFGMRRAL